MQNAFYVSPFEHAQKINEKAKYTVENGYGPAYTLNSIGIVVDPTSNIEINSWEDLWKPELKGKIAIPDITTTNKDALRDAILEERKYELALEGLRFWDLVRTGKAPSVLGSKGFIENKNELLPLPQSEIDISQGRITQNPGY